MIDVEQIFIVHASKTYEHSTQPVYYHEIIHLLEVIIDVHGGSIA